MRFVVARLSEFDAKITRQMLGNGVEAYFTPQPAPCQDCIDTGHRSGCAKHEKAIRAMNHLRSRLAQACGALE